MPYRPRIGRDRERCRTAAGRARATSGAALDVALAQIGAAFGQAAAINGFKLRIERWLVLGPRHPAVRARYGARAARFAGHGLDGAIALTERWWRDERKAFQIASALGRGNRLPREVLQELRVILRLLRRKRLHTEFGVLVAAACGETPAGEGLAEAAE